jgi:actin-related protein
MSFIKKTLEKMEIAFDQEEVVVIDMGTGYIKAGFSGDDLPRCVIPTAIAEKTQEIAEDVKNQPGGGDIKPKTHYMFGNGAIASRETHEYHEPIQRGVVVDMDRMERLLDHVFEHHLQVKTGNMNLLMTDAPMNSKDNKRALCDLVFEKFKVKSFSLMNTAVLSLFSTGSTTGLVTECGQGLTYAAPVFEGYALPHALNYTHISGQDVSEKLMRDIQENDKRVTDMDYPSIRAIKE